MSSINKEQKQLLFSYCVGLTSEEQNTEAENLISSNEEASEIYSKIKTSLLPLNYIESEPCPDDLVEKTILGINNLTNSGHEHLEQLLEAEQTKKAPIKIGIFRNFKS